MTVRLERLIVLMYHAIEDESHPSGITEPGERVYVLGTAQFERQLGHLAQSAIPVVPPGAIGRLERASRAGTGVLLTFDDGRASDHAVALPALERHGFKAFFFVTGDRIGTDGYLDEEMIRALVSAGMTVGSHGRTHRFLSEMDEEGIRGELRDSKRRLEEITGREVSSLAAPGGRIDRRVLAVAREEGYSLIFDSRPVPCPLPPGEGPVGRFAVTSGLSPEAFAETAAGRPPVGTRLRYEALGAAKRLLGNRGYERLRGLLFRK